MTHFKTRPRPIATLTVSAFRGLWSGLKLLWLKLVDMTKPDWEEVGNWIDGGSGPLSPGRTADAWPESEPLGDVGEELTRLLARETGSPVSVIRFGDTLFVDLRGGSSEIIASGTFRGLRVLVEG